LATPGLRRVCDKPPQSGSYRRRTAPNRCADAL